MGEASFQTLRQSRRALSLLTVALTLGLVVIQSRPGPSRPAPPLPAFVLAVGIVVSLVALVGVWRREQRAAEAESLERERRQFELIKLQIELSQRKNAAQQDERERLNGSAG